MSAAYKVLDLLIDGAKFDGMENVLTGVGTKTKDRINQYTLMANARKNEIFLKEFYRQNGTIRRIINILPDDMTKKPIEIDHDKSAGFKKWFKKLQVYPKLNRCLKDGKIYGTCFWFPYIYDNQELTEPVNPENITDIKPGFILNKFHVNPLVRGINDEPVPYTGYDEPEWYEITTNKGTQIYHESRVIRLEGEDTDEENKRDNSSFSESTIDIALDDVIAYDLVARSASNIADNLIQSIFKMEGLEDALDTDCEEDVQKKLVLMNMARSIVNAIVMGKNDEFQRESANVSGYKDLKEVTGEKLCVTTGMPGTKLFGKSPSASLGGNSGTGEDRTWFDLVEGNQVTKLAPALDKVIGWLKPLLKIPDDEEIKYTFPSLFQLDEKTKAEVEKIKAETRKIQSEADLNYSTLGLSGNEILNSRFATEQDFNVKTVLDTKSRQMMDDLDDTGN